MTLQNSSSAGVFVDWLDFTVPEVTDSFAEFRTLLESFGLSGLPTDDRSWVYRVPESSGVAKLSRAVRGVHRISLSGAVLQYLRTLPGGWVDLIDWLSVRAHRITRLDAALDFHVDAPRELQRLRRRVSQLGGELALGQRATGVTWLLGRDESGNETGTMYVGKRGKNQVIARVYDKAHEVAQRTGDLIRPTLRYEVEVKGTSGKARNPCLNDLHDPRSLFWEFASPALLDRPDGVPEWSPVDFQTFTLERTAHDPLQRVVALLDTSGFFSSLVRVGASLDDPRDELRKLVNFHLEKALRTLPPSESCSDIASH